MKRRIKKILQRLNWYERIRFSRMLHWYKKISHHPEIVQHKKELEFYHSFLQGASLIFDIGAHHGFKTAAFLELCEIVIACDPDPSNTNLLRNKFKRNLSRVKIQQVALGEKEGNAPFLLHHPGSAFNTLNVKWKELLENDQQNRWNEKIQFEPSTITVKVTTLDNLINEFGVPDFIKIDAEGYEKEILKGLTTPVPFISFECLLPEFYPQLEYCIQHIQSLTDKTSFNIAVEEKMLFNSFISGKEILDFALTTPISHFEVVARLQK